MVSAQPTPRPWSIPPPALGGGPLGSRRRTRVFRGRLSAGCADGPLLNFAAKRLDGGELLIVVSNRPAPASLAAYAKRWGIECLFGDAKTRGLNMEDTRLTDPRKLDPRFRGDRLCSWASSPSRSPRVGPGAGPGSPAPPSRSSSHRPPAAAPMATS